MESLIEKATRTNSFSRLRSVMIPIVSLQISFSIKELLRNITHASGCNLIEVGKLVLVLNVGWEDNGFYYVELIKSIDLKIRNFQSGIGSILQINLLIYYTVSLNSTIFVILRRVLINGWDKNSKCLYSRVCQVWKEIFPI